MKEPDDATAWLEPDDGKRLPLRGNCRLGRSPDNHVTIDGPKASRHHAAIHAQDDEEFWLIDLGSRNGTFRNGLRLIRPTRLRHGDRITLAGATFIFRQPATEAKPATERTGPVTVVEFKERPAWLLIADIEGFTRLSHEVQADKMAVNVGRWIQESERVVEKHDGHIAKFLGDGFLACWDSTPETPPILAETLRAFHALRAAGAVKFRVAVHHGLVTFGGTVRFGEENMIGTDMNFVFRLEMLASELGETFCVSAAAEARLKPHLPLEPVPGDHEFKGFPGRQRCFRVVWPE